ncbi:trypsin family [Volvox carteri f. nagariensis]|uniref:Trypsin family n=1 Tax=Volvox carteri f. nagariensis TaxID=3068 RepID=D8THF0_VOLCA|nr:trypsin family [Volvox carteri f. nagariensis]EFJ52700.1 trypsin family [Volvox carteri f. nagariensis]|eukprot:XP_002945705.1 trypsin family [Volvox carteri f. nagariensis]
MASGQPFRILQCTACVNGDKMSVIAPVSLKVAASRSSLARLDNLPTRKHRNLQRCGSLFSINGNNQDGYGQELAATANPLDGAELPLGGGTPLIAALGSDDDASESRVVAAATPPQPTIKVTGELRRKAWALSSVLKVFVSRVDPNYAQPWQMCPQRTGTGSAFVLDTGKRTILTNSHVVSNATAVYVRRPGAAKKFKAEVVCEGKSPIAVAGYPVGGDNISVTKGIVSRIALVRYSATARLLSIQIDAAINPGNSGGPAFADLEGGKVAAQEAEMYGTYRGVPSPGFLTQDLENPAQRAYLKMPEMMSGVLVVKTDPLSAAHSAVQKNDVILEVDGVPIADDGTVEFREDERLEFTYLIRAKHIGEDIHLKALREGQEVCISFPLRAKDHLVPVLDAVDAVPSYFIVGGLVFAPLSSPFLEMVFGGGGGRRSRRADIPVPVLAALNQNKVLKGQQVLAHEINHGYRYSVVPCESFGGRRLHSLRHLVHLVDVCDQPFMNFGLEGGRLITLRTAEVREAGPQILATNAISSDRSPDMLLPKPEDEDWDAASEWDPAAGQADGGMGATGDSDLDG